MGAAFDHNFSQELSLQQTYGGGVGVVVFAKATERFAHGILFNEQAGVTPAWNDTSAYSAFASAARACERSAITLRHCAFFL
jgi:hypothetical protein